MSEILTDCIVVTHMWIQEKRKDWLESMKDMSEQENVWLTWYVKVKIVIIFAFERKSIFFE